MTHIINRQTRTEQLIKRFEAASVQVVYLPSGAVRLYGQYGEVITTSNVLNLRPQEIGRLCHD